MDKSKTLQELIRMSANLGRPELDYVILGEGNTSAKINRERFYIKASGACLSRSCPENFVEINISPVLDMLDGPELSDDEIKERLDKARVDKSAPRPSVETTFHACLLDLGAEFVGHTHPTAVNAILCSKAAEEIIQGRIFPDEIVYCGIRPILLPYTDPGLALAREIRRAARDYIEVENTLPKLILVRNHGLIAIGQSASEVENITAMYVKTAKILMGAYALDGVNYLTETNVTRIYTRPDEHYRLRFGEQSRESRE